MPSLKVGNELITTVLSVTVLIVLVVFLWKYWNRVVFLFTGDDRIHFTFLQGVWCFCRCGGLHNGEFTRNLTTCSCWDKCGLMNKNLLKAFGRFCGLVAYQVEVSNIVIGDLPYDKCGDFYMSVEVGADPPMVTALQEDKPPKVIHFPEVMQLRVFNSGLASNVRMVVKQLDIAGSLDVCEILIPAQNVVDWADAALLGSSEAGKKPIKRMTMRDLTGGLERETPAWIAIQFQLPTEDRRQIQDIYQPAGNEVIRSTHGASYTETTHMTDRGGYFESSMRDFKEEFNLMDSNGNPVSEPNEEFLNMLRTMRRRAGRCVTFLRTLGIAFALAYFVFHCFVWSCTRQFYWLTMAKASGATFPISKANLHAVIVNCTIMYAGTGVEDGIPCKPNEEQVLAVCNDPPQVPLALGKFIYDYTGFTLKHGFKCWGGCCAIDDEIRQYWYIGPAIAVAILLSSVFYKGIANHRIKTARIEMSKERQDGMKKAATKRGGENGDARGVAVDG